MLLCGILIYISYIDIKKYEIPNLGIFLLLVYTIIFQIILPATSISAGITLCLMKSLSGILGFGSMFLIHYLTGSKVGFGDVMLVGALGFCLHGWMIFTCLMLALFLLAMTGMVLVFLKKICFQTPLPFAPFLAISTVTILICVGV